MYIDDFLLGLPMLNNILGLHLRSPAFKPVQLPQQSVTLIGFGSNIADSLLQGAWDSGKQWTGRRLLKDHIRGDAGPFGETTFTGAAAGTTDDRIAVQPPVYGGTESGSTEDLSGKKGDWVYGGTEIGSTEDLSGKKGDWVYGDTDTESGSTEDVSGKKGDWVYGDTDTESGSTEDLSGKKGDGITDLGKFTTLWWMDDMEPTPFYVWLDEGTSVRAFRVVSVTDALL
jgi:hypothetical protein